MKKKDGKNVKKKSKSDEKNKEDFIILSKKVSSESLGFFSTAIAVIL